MVRRRFVAGTVAAKCVTALRRPRVTVSLLRLRLDAEETSKQIRSQRVAPAQLNGPVFLLSGTFTCLTCFRTRMTRSLRSRQGKALTSLCLLRKCKRSDDSFHRRWKCVFPTQFPNLKIISFKIVFQVHCLVAGKMASHSKLYNFGCVPGILSREHAFPVPCSATFSSSLPSNIAFFGLLGASGIMNIQRLLL